MELRYLELEEPAPEYDYVMTGKRLNRLVKILQYRREVAMVWTEWQDVPTVRETEL